VCCLFTDDIMVRFVQQDTDGNTVWEAYGHFGPFDVHRQVCVLITTSTCIFGRLMCSSSAIFRVLDFYLNILQCLLGLKALVDQ